MGNLCFDRLRPHTHTTYLDPKISCNPEAQTFWNTVQVSLASEYYDMLWFSAYYVSL